MDNTRGQFEEIDPKKFQEQMQKALPRVFQEGEIMPMRDQRLRVEQISEKRLVLKLLDPIKDGSPKPLPSEVFSKSEIFEHRGSRFFVEGFKKKNITLKLLPKLREDNT